jgi:hypothetical protein
MEEEDDKKDHADVVSLEKRMADEPRAKSQSDSQSNDRKKEASIQKKEDEIGSMEDEDDKKDQADVDSSEKRMADGPREASPEERAIQFMNTLLCPSPDEKKKLLARIARDRAAAERSAIRRELPEYVCLPNEVLSDWFEKDVLKEKVTVFRTHNVLGDGNCMYHCLSESTLLGKYAEHFASKHKELRAWLALFAEQGKNRELAFKVWNGVKGKREGDTFEGWFEEIRTLGKWGGSGELIVFAAAFGIHVISVEQVENKVQTFTTITAFERLRVKITAMLPSFGNTPQSDFNDVIFLWNHDHALPRKIRKITDDPSNHYTLLELSDKKKEDLLPGDQVFISIMHHF